MEPTDDAILSMASRQFYNEYVSISFSFPIFNPVSLSVQSKSRERERGSDSLAASVLSRRRVRFFTP